MTFSTRRVIRSRGGANRIPIGAWTLMGAMAIFCNLLVGYGEQRRSRVIAFILPAVVSTSFLFIADLDSPRGGIIRVHPQNLSSLSESIEGRGPKGVL